ncbi:MAG: hypothetical protein RLZZ579_510 [Actinomycetota bacterium]
MRLRAAALAAVLLLTGCVPIESNSETKPSFITPPTTPTTVAEYYDQELIWQKCYQDFECAYAMAPLNWSDVNEKFIQLALIKKDSENTDEILLVNPGGPGVSAVTWVKDGYASLGTANLKRAFDIVTWDPRGVGDSSAVRCSDDALKDEYLYGQPVGGLNSDADIEAATAVYKNLIKNCVAGTGELISFVGTDQSARDMDLIRALLGQAKLNYLGYSYGTELGAKYLALFPENADRFVLDGAVDPTLDDIQTQLLQAEGFEKAFSNYLENCLEQSDCPFEGPLANAKSQVAKFLLEREVTTMPTEIEGRELGVWGALTGIVAALYSEVSWPVLTDALRKAFDGDGSDLLFLADFYNDRYIDYGYMTNLTEANLAISCADARDIEGKYDLDEINAQILRLAPTFGRYFETSDVGCEDWPETPALVEYDYRVDLSLAALVIGTTGDPATPYEQAGNLVELLGDARLMTFEGEGHTAYPGSTCVNRAVEEFLIESKVSSSNITCR